MDNQISGNIKQLYGALLGMLLLGGFMLVSIPAHAAVAVGVGTWQGDHYITTSSKYPFYRNNGKNLLCYR